jgi:hypothetical protein
LKLFSHLKNKKMAQKNKVLPYVLFGIPLLIGGYFVFKALKKAKQDGTSNTDAVKQGAKDAVNATTTAVKTVAGAAVGATTGAASKNDQFPLQKGSKGALVKNIQTILGVTPDSDFGVKTEAALVKAIGKKVISSPFDISGYAATKGYEWNVAQQKFVFNAFIGLTPLVTPAPTVKDPFSWQIPQ